MFGSFKRFTRKCIKSGKTLVRRSEREERRESPDQRERGTIAPRCADERRDRRSSDAIDERARRTIAPLIDRRAVRVRQARSSIDERRDRRTSALVDRTARSTIAPLVGAARRDRPSLSLIWALFSLFSLIVGRAFCRI